MVKDDVRLRRDGFRFGKHIPRQFKTPRDLPPHPTVPIYLLKMCFSSKSETPFLQRLQVFPGTPRGGSRKKNSKGRVVNRSGAPTYRYPKFKNGFLTLHFISVVPFFSCLLFTYFFQTFSMMPLTTP